LIVLVLVECIHGKLSGWDDDVARMKAMN